MNTEEKALLAAIAEKLEENSTLLQEIAKITDCDEEDIIDFFVGRDTNAEAEYYRHLIINVLKEVG